MELLNRWPRLLEAIGARGDSPGVFADLDRRYREPGRYYHTWKHVADCLAELDAAPGLCDAPASVELALWFHDAVYDPRATDNEARSAVLLREAAVRREYGFLPDPEWRAGRSRVLRMFLELPRIYLTDAFHDRLEQQARTNLAASLERLA